jgi:hypothetical protein
VVSDWTAWRVSSSSLRRSPTLWWTLMMLLAERPFDREGHLVEIDRRDVDIFR